MCLLRYFFACPAFLPNGKRHRNQQVQGCCLRQTTALNSGSSYKKCRLHDKERQPLQ